MSDPSLAMQGAIVTALKADPAVQDLAGARVIDRAQSQIALPFVSIGPAQHIQDDADCIDGSELFQQVDCWSREPGFVEVKRLADAVRRAVHRQTFSFDGFAFEIEHRVTRYMRDADPNTSHAAIEFRAFVDETANEEF
jgi:hypothetical protein